MGGFRKPGEHVPHKTTVTRVLTLTVAIAATACAGRTPIPEPGDAQGTPPDLRGSRVMVLPVQNVTGVAGDVDAEVAFGLHSRGEGVTWILPPRLQQAVDRAPGLNARIRGLPVGTFASAEVRRVGDPLYGELRRLAALVDGEVVLLPVQAWTRVGEEGEHVRLSAALIHIRSGRVMWFGVVEGDARPAADPGALASAVDALARTLLWYVPGTDMAATGG